MNRNYITGGLYYILKQTVLILKKNSRSSYISSSANDAYIHIDHSSRALHKRGRGRAKNLENIDNRLWKRSNCLLPRHCLTLWWWHYVCIYLNTFPGKTLLRSLAVTEEDPLCFVISIHCGYVEIWFELSAAHFGIFFLVFFLRSDIDFTWKIWWISRSLVM